jgi:uncharacterized protein
MSIKLLLRDSASENSIPISRFKEIMGVHYQERIHFMTPRVQSKIEKRCRKAHERGRLGQRQLWLGQYYAQEIQSCRIPDITIAWIDETIGYGVWTNTDIPAFTYIGEYTGVLRRPYFFKDRTNYYCFNYYITMNYWERNVGSPYLIDAREEGNFTRYINHSDRPNLDMASAYHGGALHIIFYAKTFIPKGTQLSYDYGPIYWEKRSKPLPL